MASTRKETTVSTLDIPNSVPQLMDGGAAIERLLFVADAAVADVGQLPPPVRAVIDAAAAVYVLTPTLPGRLAWLADEVDEVRHVADERLDTVLGHMHSIGAHASGAAARGSVLTVIADAILEFRPDHILLALRSAEHANWQERGLVKHIEHRFGLPVTTYAVDPQGRASSADGPLLLCFDGSDDARRAIKRAGALFAGRHALVVTVWQPIADLDDFAWTGAIAGQVNIVELNRGVMGSRGLTGVRSMLLGSVSSAVVHHADRPTLIIRHPVAA
jgi:hypothetical protein